MHSLIPPNTYVALRLPNELVRLIKTVPNSVIELGRYGTFPVNSILGRPFHRTYEILDRPVPPIVQSQAEANQPYLRVLSAAEVNCFSAADEPSLEEQVNPETEETSLTINGEDGEDYEIRHAPGTGEPPTIEKARRDESRKTNRSTVDSGAHQTMTMAEILELKSGGKDGGRAIIAKLMASHSAIDQKTAFSLAKYAVRKQKKFLRRFTVKPIDVGLLSRWILESREPMKIMELREEMLGLMICWANVHYTSVLPHESAGRWLVVDDTGGLVLAAVADKIGILYPRSDITTVTSGPNTSIVRSNLITMIHPATQPNLSLLRYFGYDSSSPDLDRTHPLHSHLRTVSLLQLIEPSSDFAVSEEPLPPRHEAISGMSSPQRAKAIKKRKRWEGIVDGLADTNLGNYDSLVIASFMDPIGLLQVLIPLLTGGAKICIYNPYIEPLMKLVDLYSTVRRNAYIAHLKEVKETGRQIDNTEFPLDPRVLIRTEIQTSKVKKWQCLPERTHPLMTGRGGAEGYLFTAVKVLPLEGDVIARGTYSKKKSMGAKGPDAVPDGVEERLQ